MAQPVRAVSRALAILEAFTEHDLALPLSEIARRTGMYKSTALRLAETLCQRGYLVRCDDGTYRVGPAPFHLGMLYQKSFRLEEVVRPVLRELALQCGETASFYVREGNWRVCLFRVESPRPIRHSVAEGDRLPLHLGAAGKVLLAFSGEAGEEFEAIRARGYAVTRGERDSEAGAVAAAVLGWKGMLRGALTLSGPKERFEPPADQRLVSSLLPEAARLSRALGYTGPMFAAVEGMTA